MNTYQRIRDLREDCDLTQAQVAEVLFLQREVYRRYETGAREIPLNIAVQLAKFYNVTIDYIAGLTDVKRPLFIDVSNHAFILGTPSTGKTQTAKHLQEILAEKLTEKD